MWPKLDFTAWHLKVSLKIQISTENKSQEYKLLK